MVSPVRSVVEHHAVVYSRTWRGTAFSSVIAPVLYLAALGLGLGGLVNGTGGKVAGLDYVDFLAPGLLAATVMQTAISESTWPIMAAIRWVKIYDAMLSTPLRVSDLVAGTIAWLGVRLALAAGVFVLVATPFGVWHSPLALLCVPAGVLTGLAFGAPIMGFAASLDNDQGFVLLYRLGIIPLFLFSGTFFPLSQLPTWMQGLAWLSPLWHGVSLCRAFAAGSLPLAALGHMVFLLGWLAIGWAYALRAFTRRLVS